jgi:cytochrome c-type biogenesis protein CcmI
MMTSFWLAAIFMLLVACIFVLVPMFTYQNKVSKSGQTSDWFHAREQELAKEYGLGKYTEQEYKDALTELKLTAKDELTTQANATTDVRENKVIKPYLFTATIGLVVVVIGFYAYKGLYQQVDDWQQTLLKMPELSKKVIENLDSEVSQTQLQEFALGLRTKLSATTSEDYIGWMILGRVLMSLQDVDGALSSFEKSYNLQRSNVSNTVSFAQALQMKGEEFEIKRSLTLLQEAMVFQPDNELAVILFGEGNFMLERFDIAKQGFEFALQILDKQDPRIELIKDRLEFIEQQLTPKNIRSIQVSVSVIPELNSQLEQFSHVFIFAKTDQMPMPIAVKKLPLTTMPINVSLSDNDMMIEGQKLSDYAQVNVFARLSVDENAPFEQGDWQGSLLNISTTGSETINTVIINKEYK